MKQTYITTMPLQFQLGEVKYENVQKPDAQDTIVTSFPIRQIMHNTLRAGDIAKVIAIVLENDDTMASLEVFRKEMQQEGVALTAENFSVITIPENQKTETLLRLCQSLIDALPEVSRVYACITYGTKPIPLVTINALICAEKMKRELEIGGIYYGELPRVGGKARNTDAAGNALGKLYDITALYRISGIISQISEPTVAKGLFDQLLHLGAPEEAE